MTSKEISRLKHDNIEYIFGADIEKIEILGECIDIPFLWFHITLRSSKNKREAWLEKYNAKFNIININSPFSFYKKVYNIFDSFLKSYNYVSFFTHKDYKEKRREKIYELSLKKMGFKKLITLKNPYNNSNIIVMCKKKPNVKNKKLKDLFTKTIENYYS